MTKKRICKIFDIKSPTGSCKLHYPKLLTTYLHTPRKGEFDRQNAKAVILTDVPPDHQG